MVAKLDQLAEELGLRRTTFTDPSGLRGNQSTAREMAIALAAAMADPVLADILATREVAVTATHRRAKPILYRNTNLALHDPRYQVTGGKTGYTEAAGYCLVVSARLAGRDLMMAFLGTSGELTRFADFYRFAGWFVAGGERRLRAASIGDSLTGRGALPWVVAGPR
jgi:D-alanyl-D-alanine endopeptidase (penicillin-binding protein 7)